MTVGAYRPLDDCLRIAFTELVAWIHHDYGLSELDSYELLSKVARIHLNEMVDPNYVIVASIEKKFLRRRRNKGTDVVDIVEAADPKEVETAAMIIRAYGHAATVTLVATP